MRTATFLTLILSATLPLGLLSQSLCSAQTSQTGKNLLLAQNSTQGGQSSQYRAFPTTNYYRSPYARPPGYRPGEYAARAYARQMQQEEERRNPQSQHQPAAPSSGAAASSSSSAGAARRSSPAANTPTSAKAYSYQDTISIDGMNRTFQCHLPPGYRTLKNMPLVLCFHGLQLNGSIMMFLTNFNSVADKHGFAVVYGDGIGKQWDAGNGSSGYDDVGYVCKVIDKMASTVSIDRRRVYACGISNGGYFSQLLACAIPDRLAAIGVIGSTCMKQAANQCHSSKSMPIMFFLGTGDPLVAWGSAASNSANGELQELVDMVGASKYGGVDSPLARLGGVLSVPDLVDFWTAHNHCASANPYVSMEPDRDPKDGTRVQKQVWGGSGNEVILYKIEGGGHTWPGGFPYASQQFAGRISQDIDASETLWQFFKTHSR